MSEHAATRQTAAAEGASKDIRLRRNCACGQHTIAGEECAACRTGRIGRQHRSPGGGTSDGRGGLAAAPDRIQHHRSSPRTPRRHTEAGPSFAVTVAGLRRHSIVSSPSDGADGRQPSSVVEAADHRQPDPGDPSRQATRLPIDAADSTGAEPGASATATSASGLLQADEATSPAPEQMRKSEFLDQLRTAVCATAEAALAASGQSTDGCPYLVYWFDYYGRQSAEHIEAALHRYAPETRRVGTAREYIPLVTARVRAAVDTWVRTGEITGVPEGIPDAPPAAAAPEGQPPPLFMARPGGARAAEDPATVQRELGSGRPLDGPVRRRMESAFGRSFGHVRAHTGATPARLSSEQNARAFTVGEHVAFGAGEYRPGTLMGDALIAHELAHVVQQHNAGEQPVARMSGDGARYGALEQDADHAAAGVLAKLWSGTVAGASDAALNAMPRLRSGLSLQRCSSETKVEFKEFAACTAFDDTTSPPTLMVPKSGTNKAKAEIDPASRASQVTFESADRAKATVSPAAAAASPQTVTVTGVAKGGTTINAKKAGASQVLASMAVDVKERVDKTVEIHGITETSNTPNLVPTSVPGDAALQTYLNDTVWGKQANVFFTVTRSDKNVAYDLDSNGKLADPVLVSATSAEINAISTAAKAGGVDFNIYYINEMEVPHAFTIRSRGEAWIQDTHVNSTVNVTAHELGHALGRGGESANVKDVMYEAGLASNPCEVRKRDWDAVNP